MEYKTEYIFRSNNFDSQWTWAKRYIIVFLLSLVILFSNIELFPFVIKSILLFLSLFFFRCFPVQDIGISKDFVHIFYTSKFSRLTKETRYPTVKITSMRCAGLYNKSNDVLEFFAPKHLYVMANEVEFSFDDNSSESLSLLVYKKDIIQVISQLYEMKKNNIA